MIFFTHVCPKCKTVSEYELNARQIGPDESSGQQEKAPLETDFPVFAGIQVVKPRSSDSGEKPRRWHGFYIVKDHDSGPWVHCGNCDNEFNYLQDQVNCTECGTIFPMSELKRGPSGVPGGGRHG